MHLALLLFGIIVANVLCDEYTDKLDNIDLESIIKNDRLLKNYVDCLLDKGPCTNDGKELKKHAKDILDTDCSKCSDKQKQEIGKAIKFLYENKKEMWNQLVVKYDPDGAYRKKHPELSRK